jgi:hypothetical protein
VKHTDGEITYHDITQGDSFRHPAGVCVSTPNIQQISQAICTDTLASFKARYLGTPVAVEISPPTQRETGASEVDKKIECTMPNLPKFLTSARKCTLIGGSINE